MLGYLNSSFNLILLQLHAEGHGQVLSAAWTNDKIFQGLERYLGAKS